jgi:uncharacterized protein
MNGHEIYFIVLAFFSELIGSLSGVSSSTLFVPLATLFESFQVTLALTAIIHVMGNSTRTFLYWKEVNWDLTFRFGIPSIIFTAVGAEFSSFLSPKIYSICLGIVLMILSGYLLRNNEKNLFQGFFLPYVAGALSGLLTGMVGSGGAVRSAALVTFGLSPTAFLATSTLIDFGGDIIRLFVYLKKNYLNSDHYFYIPILLISTLSANLLAKKYLARISQEKFKKLVLLFVFFMGLVTIFINLFFTKEI